MKDVKNVAEEAIDHTGELIDTYYRLFVVNATDKGSKVVAVGVSAILMVLFLFTAVVFIGIGTALWTGEVLHNMKAGFFLTGGGFILLLALFAACRKKVVSPMVRNAIIRKIYE